MTERNKRLRVMWDNYLYGVTPSFSSLATGYSAAHFYNTNRSLTVAFGGNFTISATNNKVYINDGGDLTITLTSGNYTYATLASHIQTQLNAASSNWTCTYDLSGGTYKFTITRSSGTAVLRFSQTSNAAWDTLGFTGSVDDNSGPFVADEQRNHSEEYVTWDLGTSMQFGFFSVIPKAGDIFPISSSATIQFLANATDSWSSPSLTRTLERTTNGIFEFFDDLEAAARTYRYIRFRFVDRLNTVGPLGFELALAWLSTYTTFDERYIVPGYTLRTVDPSVMKKADSGVEYWRKRQKYRAIEGLTVSFATHDEFLDVREVFETAGVTDPFFIALDPLEEVSSTADELTLFARFDGEIRYPHFRANEYSIQFNVKEVV